MKHQKKTSLNVFIYLFTTQTVVRLENLSRRLDLTKATMIEREVEFFLNHFFTY